jgi:general secretion pathway protein G
MKNVFRRKGQGGSTLLQFVLVVLVSSVLSAVALNRYEYYREQAEIAAARDVVAALRHSLQARSAQVEMDQREAELRKLAAGNPMNLLPWKPENNLREYYSPDPKRIGRGGWVYDPRDKFLVYLPKNSQSYSFSAARYLKFKVEFVSKSKTGLALNQVSG